MRVLLVEDDELVASGIIAGLRLSGVEVDRVASATEAEAAAWTAAFDVMVLDLGLPDGDGMTLLRNWRAVGKHWPLLVLTARDTVHDKVAGLRAGADDYLVKPFDLDELVARLHALRRRSAGRSNDRIEHGPLAFDQASGQVTLHGMQVDLSRRELALLQTLLDSGKRILSAEQVKNSLYGFSECVESNALNVHIHHLRRKLGPDIVETVRGLGYRLGRAGT
jgi:two-component system, OmpR family, response regulator QseB